MMDILQNLVQSINPIVLKTYLNEDKETGQIDFTCLVKSGSTDIFTSGFKMDSIETLLHMSQRSHQLVANQLTEIICSEIQKHKEE